MSLHVVAVITAKPGSEDAVGSALSGLVEPTRAESGNVSYDLSRSNADPSVFVTEEVWESQDALDGHMKAPHLAAALGAVQEHLAAPPSIHPLTPYAG